MMQLARAESFDVVSQVDLQEVDNAVNQAAKEIAQRYDFKDSNSTIEWDKAAQIKVVTDNEYRLQAIEEIIKVRMIRRKVPLQSVEFGRPEQAGGGRVRQTITIAQGIDADKGRAIIAHIKGLKLKVQAQMMEDRVRVSSKSRDGLQAVIQALKAHDFGIALQFTNYR